MFGPGTLLASRYRLDERVGSGGMGEVWRSTDTVLERTVAVKLMRQELVAEPGFAARFLVEARTMAAISHPGVVAIHDYRGDDAAAFLVMEFVEGEALARRLHRFGRLDPVRTMELVAQAAEALQAAHERGVIHRDIKPGNLLVTTAGKVVLTDFGIARSAAAAPLTVTGAVVGTPSYLAPEQVLGKPATPLTDVYALGVVAYECLAGRRPFDGDNPFEIAMKRLQETPAKLSEQVPAAVVSVVDRALAAEPERRFQSAAELAEAARQAMAAPTAAPTRPISPSGGEPAGGESGSGHRDTGRGTGYAAGRVSVPPPAGNTGGTSGSAHVPAPSLSPTTIDPAGSSYASRARSPVPPATGRAAPTSSGSPAASASSASPANSAIPAAPPARPTPPRRPARPATPPAPPPPPPWQPSQRPVVLMLACVTLLASATGLALYFGGSLRALGAYIGTYQEYWEGALDDSSASDLATAASVSMWAIAASGLVTCLVLAMLAWPLFLGKRAARGWVMTLSIFLMCCCGTPTVVDNIGDGIVVGGFSPQRDLVWHTIQVMPTWYEPLAQLLPIAGLIGLLLTLFLLSLPPATRYFLRPRVAVAPPPPPRYGYPPSR